jgi:DNA polymerase III epsilon subunit-like protein
MKVLIFDTETTGLPKTKIISQDTLDKWPHIVQFSFIIFDTETNSLDMTQDFIIRMSSDIQIPQESTNIHGITNEISREKGINIEDALRQFFYSLRNVELLVGHNVSFDINMIYIELLRIIYVKKYPEDHISAYKYDLHFLTNFKNIYCTMQETIDLCAIKANDKFGREYNKFPKLVELHQHLFGTTPSSLHNSLIDILVTLRCFVQLKYKIDCKEAIKQLNFL